MAAMANAIGNKSLFYSKYESYQKVKKSEMQCVCKVLIQLAKQAKSKSADQKLYLKESYDRTANPLWQYLNMLLALKTWHRYMVVYDSIDKDEVDIDSTDFELEEFKEQKAKLQKKLEIKEKIKLEKEKKRSRRNSKNSKNSSLKDGQVRNSPRHSGMPMSRDPSKRPTVVVSNNDFATVERLNMMEDQMDNLEKNAIALRQQTIEHQLVEERTFKAHTQTRE
jgi:hypothetical protein